MEAVSKTRQIIYIIHERLYAQRVKVKEMKFVFNPLSPLEREEKRYSKVDCKVWVSLCELFVKQLLIHTIVCL